MLFGDKSIKELDMYYNRDIKWLGECELIQGVCNKNGLELTIIEISELYGNYSDREFCSSWENGVEYLSEDYLFELIRNELLTLINDRIGRWEKIKSIFE